MTCISHTTPGKGIRRLPRRTALLGAAMLLGSMVITSATPSQAATTGGYPTALAQVSASTRTAPYLANPYSRGANTYSGTVLAQPGTRSSNQTVSVQCWYDGDTVTGNYRTNRWFRVLVFESYDGYSAPRWLFVHASYVYNQPRVRQCSNNRGIFS